MKIQNVIITTYEFIEATGVRKGYYEYKFCDDGYFYTRRHIEDKQAQQVSYYRYNSILVTKIAEKIKQKVFEHLKDKEEKFELGKTMLRLEVNTEHRTQERNYPHVLAETDKELCFLLKRFNECIDTDCNVIPVREYNEALVASIDPDDIQLCMFVENADMGSGDELYILTDDLLVYTPIYLPGVYSESNINHKFSELEAQLRQNEHSILFECKLNGVNYTCMRTYLKRVILIRQDFFVNIGSALLSDNFNFFYSNLISYLSTRGEVPTEVLYRFA